MYLDKWLYFSKPLKVRHLKGVFAKIKGTIDLYRAMCLSHVEPLKHREQRHLAMKFQIKKSTLKLFLCYNILFKIRLFSIMVTPDTNWRISAIEISKKIGINTFPTRF